MSRCASAVLSAIQGKHSCHHRRLLFLVTEPDPHGIMKVPSIPSCWTGFSRHGMQLVVSAHGVSATERVWSVQLDRFTVHHSPHGAHCDVRHYSHLRRRGGAIHILTVVRSNPHFGALLMHFGHTILITPSQPLSALVLLLLAVSLNARLLRAGVPRGSAKSPRPRDERSGFADI